MPFRRYGTSHDLTRAHAHSRTMSTRFSTHVCPRACGRLGMDDLRKVMRMKKYMAFAGKVGCNTGQGKPSAAARTLTKKLSTSTFVMRKQPGAAHVQHNPMQVVKWRSAKDTLVGRCSESDANATSLASADAPAHCDRGAQGELAPQPSWRGRRRLAGVGHAVRCGMTPRVMPRQSRVRMQEPQDEIKPYPSHAPLTGASHCSVGGDSVAGKVSPELPTTTGWGVVTSASSEIPEWGASELPERQQLHSVVPFSHNEPRKDLE